MTPINPYAAIQQIERPEFLAARADSAAREPIVAPPRENPRASEPADLRARLDDLIFGEVTSGRLTIGQAEDLRSVLNETFSDVAVGALQRSPPQSGQDTMDSPFSIDRMNASRRDGASFASGQTEVETTGNVMQKFLDALQASVESSASATYGASGQNNVAAIKTVPPLLVDYRS